MTKKLLLPILYFAVISRVSSQEYIPIINNTAWNLTVNNFASSVNFWLVQGEDVAFGSQTYTNFESAYYVAPYPDPVVNHYYIREEPENKRVYEWLDGAERLIFDFSLEESEQMEMYDGTIFTVVQKDSINMMSGRKSVRMRLEHESSFYLPEIWIEGLGNAQHPFIGNYNTPSDPVYTLNCSFSNGSPHYNRGLNSWSGTPVDCPEPPNMATAPHKAYKVMIGPNPFSDSTIISTNYNLTDASLTLYNMLGQAVREINHISGDEVTFFREGLSEGLYHIRLTENGKDIFSEKIVVAD